MEVINTRQEIRNIAKTWKRQYPSNKQDILKKLLNLDKEKTQIIDIETIIGNSSWIGPYRCHECGKYSYELIWIGEDLDYESCTARLCIDCLKQAIQKIEDYKKTKDYESIIKIIVK